MLPTTVPNRTASETAAPRVPPIERKNVTELVDRPMSLGGSAFWTTITSICMVRPRPIPTTSMYAMTCGMGVSTFRVESSSMPINMVAVPRIGKILYLPVRCMIRPTTSDVPIRPIINGVIIRPAAVGLCSLTICR